MFDHFKVDEVFNGGVVMNNIRYEVPETMICAYFGPKSNKSGWENQLKTFVKEQDAILRLYRRVKKSDDMPNKEITLQFVRGLILMFQDTKVNWKGFTVDRRKYREGLWRKRELTYNIKIESSGDWVDVAPPTIGKK